MPTALSQTAQGRAGAEDVRAAGEPAGANGPVGRSHEATQGKTSAFVTIFARNVHYFL